MLFRLVFMQSNWTKLVYDNFSNKTTNSEILKWAHVTVEQIYPSFASKWGGVKISVHNFVICCYYFVLDIQPYIKYFCLQMFPSVTNVSVQTVLKFCNPHILLNLLSSILSEAASLKTQLVNNPPAMQETLVRFLGGEDLLEKG